MGTQKALIYYNGCDMFTLSNALDERRVLTSA